MRVRIDQRRLTEMAGWRSSPSRRANCRARNTAPEEPKTSPVSGLFFVVWVGAFSQNILTVILTN